jgi:hypothetical protein
MRDDALLRAMGALQRIEKLFNIWKMYRNGCPANSFTGKTQSCEMDLRIF